MRYTGATPFYSKDIIDNVITMTKISLILRNLLTIYFLGANEVFPYDLSYKLLTWEI